MPFHLFGPPHHLFAPHLSPVIVSSALAFAAGAYWIGKDRLPAGFTRLSTRLSARLKDAVRRSRADAEKASHLYARSAGTRHSSGNRAFDDYRAATLDRLEREGSEFRSYLDGLRSARDKFEFDQFLNQRRGLRPSAE